MKLIKSLIAFSYVISTAVFNHIHVFVYSLEEHNWKIANTGTLCPISSHP